MSYHDTARAYVDAGRSHNAAAAAALPLSDWAEPRRDNMTPQTIAHNHALHVSDAAGDLRAVIAAYDADAPEYQENLLRDAARALLAAIGEGVDHQ